MLSLTEETGPLNDHKFVVVDDEDFAVAEGETPEDAIKSARKITNDPISTYWGRVPANETEISVGEEESISSIILKPGGTITVDGVKMTYTDIIDSKIDYVMYRKHLQELMEKQGGI